jgi:cysteine desulfurase
MTAEVIYLDNNASTPVDPRVLQVLNTANAELYGNPSNLLHSFGRLAHEALSYAREKVRSILQAEDFQVIFTSGATEALNIAIQGLRPSRVIVGSTEHKAVLNTCRWLARTSKTSIVSFSVDESGVAELNRIEEALKSPASLVVAMLANNETGVLHPIREIGLLSTSEDVPLLCDVTQAIGKVPVKLNDLPADIVVLSGHKIYGPKGVGALLYRQNFIGKIRPVLHGGGQEFGLRAGTENVPAILGFVKALEIAITEQLLDAYRMKEMRDSFETSLCRKLTSTIINGGKVDRLPNTSNFSIPYVRLEKILDKLSIIAISTGAACATQQRGGSHVLRAMGVPDELAFNSIRVSFGRFNRPEDARMAAETISEVVDAIS